MNMEIAQVPLDRIFVGHRLRPVDADWVDLLAERMAASGQETPIQLRAPDERGDHTLIAGAHRLAAAMKLGWPSIAAILRDVSDLEAELAEVEENLIRHELTPLDRAVFVAEHQRLWLALHPEAGHGGTRRGKRGDQAAKLGDLKIAERFSQVAREKFGLSARTVQRAVQVAESLAEDVRKSIAGTWLSRSGSQLEALARLTHDNQRRAIARLLAEGGPRQVAAALAEARPPRAAWEGELARLEAAWRKAGARARGEFLRRQKLSRAEGDAA